MFDDDVLTRNEDGELAVRTVSSTEGSNPSAYDDVFTRDENGKLCLRVVGGGGSGDSHNKGYYATPEALREAYPTAESGDWAIVGSTDTVWVWDEDSTDWVDTDTKGEVTPDMIIVKSATMPTASTTPAGAVYQYVGTTNSTYTHGYIYENIATAAEATASQTYGSGLTDISVTNISTFASAFETGFGTSIFDTTVEFEYDDAAWMVSTEIDGQTETLLDQDITDWAVTFTGTPQEGDTISVVYTGATYAWTRVDVQPAPDLLPSQTGNAGKFLITNGTDASWSDKPLVNVSNSYLTLGIGTEEQYAKGQLNTIIHGKVINNNGNDNVVIGINANFAYKGESNVIIGEASVDSTDSTVNNSISIGHYARSGKSNSISIGSNVRTSATNAIQLGFGTGTMTPYINSDANTFKVGNANGNFEIMSADGTIPTDRLTKVNTTVTLAAADWSSNTQTVSVTGVTATGVVFVSPDPTDQADYTSAGIYCSAQAAGSLEFTCDTTPSNDIDVVVVQL